MEPLTVEKVKNFKVEELKSALKARQLSQNGKKNELMDRLIEALTNEGSNENSNTTADNSGKKDAEDIAAKEGTEMLNEAAIPQAVTSSSETTAGTEESNSSTTGTTAEAKEEVTMETTTIANVEVRTIESSSSSSSSNNTTIEAALSMADTQTTVMTVSEPKKSMQDNVVSAVVHESDTSEAAVPSTSDTIDTKVTYHVRIDNFQRPLTDKALYTWMTEKLGHPVDSTQLWLNKIKTHCYMDFPTREAAQACIDAVTGCKVDSKHSLILEADFTDVSVAEAEESGEAKCKPGEWKAFRDAAKLTAMHGKGTKASGSNSSSSWGNDGGYDMMRKGTVDAGLARQLLGTTGALRRGREEETDAEETVNQDNGHGNKKARMEMVNEMEDNDQSVLALDSLFRKTNAQPSLYWLPVTDEEIQKRIAQKGQNNS